MKPLTITFDPAKASTNLRKHGVSFEEAATVFRDPLAITVPDHEHSDEESREITCGYSVREHLLLVVHTEIVEDCLRIISARKATRQEQDDYANA